MRRARGYAPLPISLWGAHAPSRAVRGASPRTSSPPEPADEAPAGAREGACAPQILAVGAHLKNTVALSVGDNVFVSQHIGDLETEQAYRAFKNAAADLPRLFEARPEIIACDLHPEYLSTKFAHELADWGARATSRAAFGDPPNARSKNFCGESPQSARESRALPRKISRIQHHWAHIAACMAENDIESPALGVAWDGTGFGSDGTIWGGEVLLAKNGISNALRICVSFDCLVAKLRSRNRGGLRWVCSLQSLVTTSGAKRIWAPRFRSMKSRCFAKFWRNKSMPP